jgi:hypothetical protein
MALTYADSATLNADPVFQNQVLYAMLDYAKGTVFAEGAGAANHALRVALAQKVKKDPYAWLPVFSANVAAINTLNLTNTDLAILGAMGTAAGGLWNDLADVAPP